MLIIFFFSSFGFLDKADKKPANTIPIPTPEPANDIVAKPAPINLDNNKRFIIT